MEKILENNNKKIPKELQSKLPKRFRFPSGKNDPGKIKNKKSLKICKSHFWARENLSTDPSAIPNNPVFPGRDTLSRDAFSGVIPKTEIFLWSAYVMTTSLSLTTSHFSDITSGGFVRGTVVWCWWVGKGIWMIFKGFLL